MTLRLERLEDRLMPSPSWESVTALADLLGETPQQVMDTLTMRVLPPEQHFDPAWVASLNAFPGVPVTPQFNPATATWYGTDEQGQQFTPFAYGGVGWQGVTGDWDGNGSKTIAVVDPNGVWYLKNSNTAGAPDVAPFAYGGGGWRAVSGDFDPTHPGDEVGSVDPATGLIYMATTHGVVVADHWHV